jgi:hypothetical protein
MGWTIPAMVECSMPDHPATLIWFFDRNCFGDSFQIVSAAVLPGKD